MVIHSWFSFETPKKLLTKRWKPAIMILAKIEGDNMPIRRAWRPFTDSSVKAAPTEFGVYELGDAKGEVVYIGKGGSSMGVRSRLLQHREKKRFMHVKFFRFQKTPNSSEAKALEFKLCTLYKKQHNGKLPRLQRAAPTTEGRHWMWG